MTHQCPVSNCEIGVRFNRYMCARHWRMVPKPLQSAVYESYRREGRLSVNHQEALRVVNAAEGGKTALDLAAGMKALTIWQPWASLVMIGAKPYEFRRWNFADKTYLAGLIGQRIVIHAGARRPRLTELDDLLARIDEGESALDARLARPLVTELHSLIKARCEDAALHATAPLGVALGTAILGQPRRCLDLFRDVIADSSRIDEHMYGWPLSDVQAFPQPLPGAGAQGFWNFT